MIELIPKKSLDQQLRIKRFLIGTFSYIIFILTFIICHWLGLFRLPLAKLSIIIGMIALINLGFYLVFLFDINLYFKEKSLTIAQITVGTIVIMIAIYYANEARGAFLLLYMVTFSFGVFRLKVRQFLFLTLIVITGYSVNLSLLKIYHPETLNMTVELLRLLILSVVFTWFSFIGGYINRLREKVEELATKDGLTKVFNRRKIFEVLEREVELSKRQLYHFGLLMIDIDDFKKINDSYGHLAGDLILTNVAKAIKIALRTEDYLGRYGGEEFLAVLTNPTPENALLCANRIKEVVENLETEFKNKKIKVTISTGVTVYLPDESLDTTLARADKALYMAKERGKNTVVALDFTNKELKQF